MNYHILGNGGFGRELLASLCGLKTGDSVSWYWDGKPGPEESAIEKLTRRYKDGEIYFGVGSPKLKEKWAKEFDEIFMQKHEDKWLNGAILPIHCAGKILDPDKCAIAEGVIICHGSIITTNVTIGQFVTINLNCTVGHDSTIDDFSTLAPGCNIAGNVHIGKSCDIGQNVAIIPGVELPDGGIIGANSVILKTPNVQEIWDNANVCHTFKHVWSYVMVGNPARVIKINDTRVD